MGSDVVDFARKTTAGMELDYQKVIALRDAIWDRSVYTLTPAFVPIHRELVSWFLETGEGYCTYYATAMAVLARSIGIPSRYVEGFSTFSLRPRRSGGYMVTGEQAHAWAEVYVEGVGWIPVDASLGAFFGDRASMEAWDNTDWETLYGMDFWEDEWWDESGQDIVDYMPVEEASGFPEGAGYILAPMSIGLLVLAIYTTIAVIRYRYTPDWLEAHYGPGGALLLYWRDIGQMLPLVGLKARPNETPTKLTARLESEENPQSGVRFTKYDNLPRIGTIVEDFIYGGISPDIYDLMYLFELHRRLDAALMRRLLPIAYLRRRIGWRFPKKGKAV